MTRVYRGRRPRRSGLTRTAVAMTVATALALSACSSSSSDHSAGSSGSCSGSDKKLHLGFVYATTSLNPFQEMAKGAKAAAKQDGNVDLKAAAPAKSNSGPQEVSDFESVTRTQSDGVAYETTSPDLFVHPVQKATKDEVPLVAVDTPAPKGTQVKTFVGNSNYDIGADLGNEFVKQHRGTKGTVVLGIDIPELSTLQGRMKGLKKTIEKKRPDMKIVGPLDSKNSPTDTYNAWNGFVQKYTDADAFLGVGGVDGTALPKIKEKTGKKYLAGSADVPPKALDNVKDGSLFALSSPEHWMKGYIAMKLLIDHNRKCKKLPDGWWNSGNRLITKKNVDSILARQKSDKARFEWFKKHDIGKQLKDRPVKPMAKAN